MPARLGLPASRRARTATSRRSTMIACTGSRPRIRIFRSCLTAASASSTQTVAHLADVDGVMIGRAAYQEPWRLLGRRSAAFRRGGAVRLAESGGRGAHSLHRARARPRHAAARYHAARARPVPRRTRGTCVPPPAGDRGDEAGRRCRDVTCVTRPRTRRLLATGVYCCRLTSQISGRGAEDAVLACPRPNSSCSPDSSFWPE